MRDAITVEAPYAFGEKAQVPMFTLKIARASLALAFVLTASGAAFAREPRIGYRDSMVESACTPPATTSYRDSAQRLGNRPVDELIATGQHGYRDAFVRLPSQA